MNIDELKERQSWNLYQKIDHSLGTIESFVNRLGGIDKVFISFSGGKDSTVLLDIARRIYPDITAVFCNTGNEYPEILQFVRQLQKTDGYNIEIIRPALTPRQVWENYGFPLISKDTAQAIHRIRYNSDSAFAQKKLDDSNKYRLPYKWRYLLSEPYETTSICCQKLKKEPFARYEKETGRHPILGVMASESILRTSQYLHQGSCNVFDGHISSRPLSIWLESDIWDYIKTFDLPISEIYKMGAKRTGCVGCGFGCQFADDERFSLLYQTHPKLYNMIMNYTNNGTTYRDALRKMLDVNNKTLPDETNALF